MAVQSLRSLSPTFIRSVELDYIAPLVTVPQPDNCPYPPEIDAGPDQGISGNTVILHGNAFSTCGKTMTYHWSYVYGPGACVFLINGLAAKAIVTLPGFYIFKFQVSDGYWTVIDTASVLFS